MAMGVYGATIGLAVAFGPLVGGLIVDSFMGVDLLPERADRRGRDSDLVPAGARVATPNATGVDWPGSITFSSAPVRLVLALIRSNEQASSFTVGLLAASAVLLAAFIAIERRVAEPMLPLGLFKRPAFTGVQLAAFGTSGSMFALSST